MNTKDLFDEILKIKNDENLLKEKISNSVLVAEEIWENKGSSKEFSSDISYFISKDEMEDLSNIKEKIFEHSNRNRKEELRVLFYEIKDVDKIVDDIKSGKINDDEFEEIFYENFYEHLFKSLNIEDIKKEKAFTNALEFLKENIHSDNYKRNGVTISCYIEQTSEKGERYTLNSFKDGKWEIKISETNIIDFLDKSFKYFAINGADFNTDYPEYSSFQMDNENLDKQTALENVTNSPRILSDLDDINIPVLACKGTELSSIDLKITNRDDNEFGIFIRNKENNLLRKEDLSCKKISELLNDYDSLNDYYKNHTSETDHNEIKTRFVIDNVIDGLERISDKKIDLDINKKENDIDYHLVVKDSNENIYKEIKSDNIANFAKETLEFIKKETDKELDYKYPNETGTQTYEIKSLDDLKETKKNSDFSIAVKGIYIDNNIKIEIPAKDTSKIFKIAGNSEKRYNFANEDLRKMMKELLIYENSTNEIFKNGYDDTYIKTDLIEKQANNLIKKITSKLEEETWEDIRNNALAYSLSEKVVYGGFNLSINNVFDRVKETLIDVLENKINNNKEKFLIKNANNLYLTVEDGKIKEFGTTDPNADNVDKENTYKADMNRFVEELIITEKMNLINELEEKIPNNEDYFKYLGKSILSEKEFLKEIKKLEEKYSEKSNGLIEKEEEFLKKIFISELKNQDEYILNSSIRTMEKEKFDKIFDKDKFNSKLEEIGYHKISNEKLYNISTKIDVNKLDVFFDKKYEKNVKDSEKEFKEATKEFSKNAGIDLEK